MLSSSLQQAPRLTARSARVKQASMTAVDRALGSRYGSPVQRKPFGNPLGLVLEYLMFASAVFLAISLYLTRHPMALLDRVLGLRLRERFVEFIARMSPG